MEPRFNEVLRDLEIGSLYRGFAISRVRYIENLDLTSLRKNNHVRYIVGWLIGFFVVSGSSIESLVCIIIFDHRTWKRTQDYWLQEQTCELGSLSADDTGTTTPLSNSLLKIEVVLSTSVRSFFCQISSIGISLVCSQYLWGSYITQCDNNYCLRQQFTANNFSFSPIKEKEKTAKSCLMSRYNWYPLTTE